MYYSVSSKLAATYLSISSKVEQHDSQTFNIFNIYIFQSQATRFTDFQYLQYFYFIFYTFNIASFLQVSGTSHKHVGFKKFNHNFSSIYFTSCIHLLPSIFDTFCYRVSITIACSEYIYYYLLFIYYISLLWCSIMQSTMTYI